MKKICLILSALIILISIGLLVIYKIEISSVSNNKDLKEITVLEGDTYISLSNKLKENNLIKSEFVYKIYIKLNKVDNLEAGKYYLSENMDLNTIIGILKNGSTYNENSISIQFKEGKNMRYITSLIIENTNNKEEDVYNLLKDEEYLDKIINKYWFLTDEIKNDKIYYSLEGYLFPDTYEFMSKDVTVEEIFEKMLDQMELKLNDYKEDINDQKYSIHQLLTLASIVELEGASSNDRAKVAGVFYNRLDEGWSLGSDITTYYALKMDDWSNGLTYSQLNSCNDYNTRGNCVSGLPVSPVCNPGIDSIKAVINPEITNNYYFVADCNGVTYLNETENGHYNTINKLKNEGNWCDN